jgi:hypothetical protein
MGPLAWIISSTRTLNAGNRTRVSTMRFVQDTATDDENARAVRSLLSDAGCAGGRQFGQTFYVAESTGVGPLAYRRRPFKARLGMKGRMSDGMNVPCLPVTALFDEPGYITARFARNHHPVDPIEFRCAAASVVTAAQSRRQHTQGATETMEEELRRLKRGAFAA